MSRLFSFIVNLPDGSRREACIKSITVEADVRLPLPMSTEEGPPGKRVTATGYFTRIVTPGERPDYAPALIFGEIEVTGSRLEHVINRFLNAVATAEPSR